MKTILSFAFLIFFSVSVIAQSGLVDSQVTSPEQHANKMTNQLTQDLELDANLKSKIYLVALSTARNVQELEGIKGSNPEVYASKMSNLVKDTDARILQVLDADRADLYRQLMQQREADASLNEAVQQRLQSNGNQ